MISQSYEILLLNLTGVSMRTGYFTTDLDSVLYSNLPGTLLYPILTKVWSVLHKSEKGAFLSISPLILKYILNDENWLYLL